MAKYQALQDYNGSITGLKPYPASVEDVASPGGLATIQHHYTHGFGGKGDRTPDVFAGTGDRYIQGEYGNMYQPNSHASVFNYYQGPTTGPTMYNTLEGRPYYWENMPSTPYTTYNNNIKNDGLPAQTYYSNNMSQVDTKGWNQQQIGYDYQTASIAQTNPYGISSKEGMNNLKKAYTNFNQNTFTNHNNKISEYANEYINNNNKTDMHKQILGEQNSAQKKSQILNSSAGIENFQYSNISNMNNSNNSLGNNVETTDFGDFELIGGTDNPLSSSSNQIPITYQQGNQPQTYYPSQPKKSKIGLRYKTKPFQKTVKDVQQDVVSSGNNTIYETTVIEEVGTQKVSGYLILIALFLMFLMFDFMGETIHDIVKRLYKREITWKQWLILTVITGIIIAVFLKTIGEPLENLEGCVSI